MRNSGVVRDLKMFVQTVSDKDYRESTNRAGNDVGVEGYDGVGGNVTKKVILYVEITCKLLGVCSFLGKWIHNLQEILKEILNQIRTENHHRLVN